MATDQTIASTPVFHLPITGRRDGVSVVIAYARIPDDDFTREFVAPYAWNLTKRCEHIFRTRSPRGEPRYTIYLHRLIYEHYCGTLAAGQVADHIDRNTLNCLPDNLRPASARLNAANRKRFRTNSTGYTGVYLIRGRRGNRWRAIVTHAEERIDLGRFDSAEDAARAVNATYRICVPEVAVPNPEVEPGYVPPVVSADNALGPLHMAPFRRPLIEVVPRPELVPGIYFLPITGRRDRRRVVVGWTAVIDDDFTQTVLAVHRWNGHTHGYVAGSMLDGNGVWQRVLLHRVVFEHYHGSIPYGLEIDHIDRVKTNNALGNLRLVTRSLNNRNQVRLTGRQS